ncbi:MAG TPA: cytochrome c peroxidase [Vicinamibacterales bacterium]|nr:cytochrome c peroxidase [Vicinamibacterales bacterium]
MTGRFAWVGQLGPRVLVALVFVLVGPTALFAQPQTYVCYAPGGFGVVPPLAPPALPPVLLSSLKSVPNPVIPPDKVTQLPTIRGDLVDYVANLSAAIRLGKALFWDVQAGSDNKTACATCHFQAGQDGRSTNQLNPGANNAWDAQAPNRALGALDFPLTRSATSDNDNIVGSQGVRKSNFAGFNSKTGAEQTTAVPDPVFNVGGVNVRQVTGKNTPSVINAVFNHRNFWNGRAQSEFNGVNPFGNRDTTARVWYLGVTGPTQIDIHIQDAALASQAVGPPLNPVEMSAANRSFPDLGHKLLGLKPLGLQKVDPTDSVLGSYADPVKGLTTTYASMIQQAFKAKWWNASSKQTVKINGKTYTMAEANTSLFWGLSIMLYEATLVADNTPLDQYLAPAGAAFPRPPLPDTTPLNQVVTRLANEGITVVDSTGATRTVTVDDILNGLSMFELPALPPSSFPLVEPSAFTSSGVLGGTGSLNTGGAGVGCIGCHVGAETTSASLRNLTGPGIEAGDAALKAAGFDLRMERMFTNLSWTPPGPLSPVPAGTDVITFDPATYAVNTIDAFGQVVAPPISLPVATYDTGWYNIGVRPTADDPGVDGTDPFGNSLSWVHLFQALSDPSIIKVPGNGLGCAGIGQNTAFPNLLLNAKGFPLLSGPMTKTESADVAGTFKVPQLRNIELNGPYFHNGGKATLAQVVDFYDGGGDFPNATKAPAIVPLMLSADQMNGLVAFLLSLTDDRVRFQQAPFDHPQLFVPNGDSVPGTDNMIEIPATGAAGAPMPLQRFLNLNPFQGR